VKIPLPDLLRKLREKQVDRGLRPWSERAGLRVWAWAALHPRIYAIGAALGARYLKFLGGGMKRIRKLPFAGSGWTETRDFPAPQGQTFRELYRRRRGA
jgi:L-lactate dehydrogenase complex protein LldF